MRAPARRASSSRARWNAVRRAERRPPPRRRRWRRRCRRGRGGRQGRPSSPTLKRISSRQLILRTVSSVRSSVSSRDERADLGLAPLDARRAPLDEALPRGGRRLVGHEQERPRLGRRRVVELAERRRAVGRRPLGRVGEHVDPEAVRVVVVLAARRGTSPPPSATSGREAIEERRGLEPGVHLVELRQELPGTPAGSSAHGPPGSSSASRSRSTISITVSITHSWIVVACMRVEPVMAIGPVVRLIFSMRGSSMTSRLRSTWAQRMSSGLL